MFGGHANPTTRLNDCWWLDVKDYTWSRVEGDKDVAMNQESPIGAPPPRANCGYYLYNNKVYIYGGHGGLNYARVAFSDIYSFDLETLKWEKYEPVQQAQPPPEGRGGNSVFVVDDKLYSYGGWNMESQFTNLIIFDLNTCEWNDPDIMNGVARWNHSAVMVEAIPSWKYFIFGGESTDFGEAQPRAFGQVVNSTCYLDLESMKWTTIECEDDVVPPAREYTVLTYDHRESRLLVFGGWNQGWLDDIYALAVSKVVGPSYAITDVDPPLGQLSGNVPITIKGVGFKDSNIKVYFTASDTRAEVPSKNSIDVVGNFVSETEITALTPAFDSYGARGAICQLSIQGGDLTTTWVQFNYFMNTRANMSLCYGPGVQESNASGHQVEFVIQARNDNAENRQSGRDEF
jgi:dynein heavy chain